MIITMEVLKRFEENLITNNIDPEFYLEIISDNSSINGTKIRKLYLLPTIGMNNEPGEIRVDFAVNENSQKRLEEGDVKSFNGAFILTTDSETSNIFMLNDSDGGLEELSENNLIEPELYNIIEDSIRNRKHLKVKIKLA